MSSKRESELEKLAEERDQLAQLVADMMREAADLSRSTPPAV